MTNMFNFVATPCSNDPCLNGGTCTVEGSAFRCSCTPRYTGNSCEGWPLTYNTLALIK